jgi:type IV pilus assembly protein PilY1
MKRISTRLQSALCIGSLFCAIHAHAYNVLTISSEPLGTGTGLTVRPNLWFVLDDSGSMDSTYTPDYVNDSICSSNLSAPGSTYGCTIGDPPYMASGFNRSYYNPAITYTPPVNSTGTSLGNATPGAAKGEPFRFPGSTSAVTTTCFTTNYTDIGSSGDKICDLTTKFPRRNWCKSDGTQCRESTNTERAASNAYAYPGIGADGQTRTLAGSTTYGTPYYYTMNGAPIWCSDKALTTCPGTKWSSATPYPRFNAGGAVNGVAATISVSVTKAGSSSSSFAGTVTKVVVDNGGALQKTLFNGTINVNGKDSQVNRNNLAVALVSVINGKEGFTATQTVTCTSSSSSSCIPIFVLTAPPGSVAALTATSGNDIFNNKALSITDSSSDISFSLSNSGKLAGGKNYQASFAGVSFTRYDVIPAVTSYPKAATRTDCAGSTCTYAEELQNFANWFSYYRGRLLMTKSAISLAFRDVNDATPGIGFRVGFSVISVGTSSPQSGFTELGIADFNTAQRASFYSKLFSITPNSYTPLRTALSRAGQMFAGNLGTDPMQYSCQQNYTFLATDGYWNTNIEPNTNFNMAKTGSVGDVDGSADAPYKDKLTQSNTLADIARYYYINDLRSSVENDVPKASSDETTSSKMWQHMKTFTMGLGVDGSLTYCTDYLSGCSPDYNTILADGVTNWGNPITNTTSARIDDLWHAAVNGHGQYFSAADPNDVGDAIAKTLAAAEQQTGSAAAAATSNLEPVAGDNYAYVASYTTNVWDGNLEAKTIDLGTGQLSTASTWSARELLDTKTTAGTRTLYTYNAGGGSKHKLMTWSNLTLAEQAYFNPTQMTACNPITNCPGATSENLFDFITGKPDATTNSDYRDRSHVLGDIVSSQPIYVKTPGFNYSDPGYDAYKTTLRQGMVYVGANDGFLHAFNADTGNEEWAYAPSAVLPNLWKLADPAYTHQYYVDGKLMAGDIQVGGWKTILVGGMNAGGKHYYAWDVTTPASPVLLWEFTDADMGFTYGNPVVTKMTDGSWVVLVTSGYNNPNGQGYLYVLDAMSGTLKKKIGTGSGSSTQPSGLAKIVNWVDDPMVNNTTKYVYGGDLNGDMWRFDLDLGTATRLAAVGEPITTRPQLVEIKYKRVVIFGSGLFLQAADRTDTGARHIFAIKDDDTTTYASVVGNGSFVEQVFTSSGDTRTLSSNSVDWDTQAGWYIHLPDGGERVNVDPKIQLGTLVVASNVPVTATGNTCTVGGYAWLNYIDFVTGSDVKNSQGLVMHPSEKITGALIVGVNIFRLPDGKVMALPTTADNRHPVREMPVGTANVKPRRISWRELTNN